MIRKTGCIVLAVLLMLSLVTYSIGEDEPATSCDHVWGNWINDPEAGNEKRVCSVCQAVETQPHDMVWEQTASEHRQVCSHACGLEPASYESHTFDWVDIGNDRLEYRCTVCGYVSATHTHQWVMDSNITGHWYFCDNDSESCPISATKDFAEHTCVWKELDAATHMWQCTVCEYIDSAHVNGIGGWEGCTLGCCVSGHSFGEWSVEGGKHVRVCATCQYRDEHGNGEGGDGCTIDCCAGHQSAGSWEIDADGNHSCYCSACGLTLVHGNGEGSGEGCSLGCCASGHFFGDWTENDGYHFHVCTICQYVEGHDNGYGAEEGCTLSCCGSHQGLGNWEVDAKGNHSCQCSVCGATVSHANGKGAEEGCTLSCCGGNHTYRYSFKKSVGQYECETIFTYYKTCETCGHTITTGSKNLFDHVFEEVTYSDISYAHVSTPYRVCKYCKLEEICESKDLYSVSSNCYIVNSEGSVLEKVEVEVSSVPVNEDGTERLITIRIVNNSGEDLPDGCSIVFDDNTVRPGSVIYDVRTIAAVTVNGDLDEPMAVKCEDVGIYTAKAGKATLIPVSGEVTMLFVQEPETTGDITDGSDESGSETPASGESGSETPASGENGTDAGGSATMPFKESGSSGNVSAAAADNAAAAAAEMLSTGEPTDGPLSQAEQRAGFCAILKEQNEKYGTGSDTSADTDGKTDGGSKKTSSPEENASGINFMRMKCVTQLLNPSGEALMEELTSAYYEEQTAQTSIYEEVMKQVTDTTGSSAIAVAPQKDYSIAVGASGLDGAVGTKSFTVETENGIDTTVLITEKMTAVNISDENGVIGSVMQFDSGTQCMLKFNQDEF